MQAFLFSNHSEEYAVLTTILQQTGLLVHPFRELVLPVDNWTQNPPDLLVLAVDRDGEKFLVQTRQLRVHTVIPIVVILDSGQEGVHVNWMEAGADLVIARPFGARLLIAQLRNLLRRSAGLPFHAIPSMTQSGLTLDPASRTVSVDGGEPIHLTHLEFRLLYTFITNPGQLIPTESLVEYVWGFTADGNRELVRGLVQRLRAKIEPEPAHPRFIQTESGVGYRLSKL